MYSDVPTQRILSSHLAYPYAKKARERNYAKSYLQDASENVLVWEHAQEEDEYQAAVGVSAERFGGDTGRSLVVVDYSRHDAAGISNL